LSAGLEPLLTSLGLITADSVETFYPRTRDRDDIRVMRCRTSGVIYLAGAVPDAPAHYASLVSDAYWLGGTRAQALLELAPDDERRAKQFEGMIRNKKWLDVGTGLGGVLDLLRAQAREIVAVEPVEGAYRELHRLGYRVYRDVHDLPDQDVDVVTLFHVFEHLSDPVETLRLIRGKLRPGGRLVVEVPHARDFLISFLDLDAFKRFTFWSEHLILHTRRSLEAFLRAAGFGDVRIEGFQRFPLANHLFWLAKGQPGGHQQWPTLRDPGLESAYAAMLDRLDATDTLIATASR
jgi:SAM-dependent methyltransferase